jgi:hypothetical protein
MKVIAACILLLAVTYMARAQDPYADFVASYVTGTGSGFEPSYDDSSVALGAPASEAEITAPAYSSSDIVGVGEGGELTVGFDTPITNDPTGHADGLDFTIFGNQFFILGGSDITGIYDHPGLTVWVSQNGTNFYELVAPDGTPHGADDLYPTEGDGNPFLPVSPSLSLSDFEGGTADQAMSLYGGSAGGASFSISWAQDAEGDPVDLPSISYIMVEGSSGYGYIDAFARVEAIPEPANILLLLFAAAGLFSMRRLGHVAAGLLCAAGLLLTFRASAQAEDFTLSNIQYWVGTGTNQSALVISWNDGIAPDSLVFGYNWNAPASGPAPTIYVMMEAIQAADPYLAFTAEPQFNYPSDGDYALYSAFYNLTGGAGPEVGTPANLGGTENGYAPAGDHYKEGWFTGFWGEVIGEGNPYDGGSWNTTAGQGLAVDTLSDDGWYGLSFSTDETNFTIPEPGYPSAIFPVPIPEPCATCLSLFTTVLLLTYRKLRGRPVNPLAI